MKKLILTLFGHLIYVLYKDTRCLDQLHIDESIIELENADEALLGISLTINVKVVFLEFFRVDYKL